MTSYFRCRWCLFTSILDALNPDKFEITQMYRFEGDTNPEDEAVVYAIESQDGHKGTLVNG